MLQVNAKIANRGNWGGQQTVIVYVDNQDVGHFSAGTGYVAVATSSFAVANGAHDIRFAGQSAADATLLIDQVSVVSVMRDAVVANSLPEAEAELPPGEHIVR